jgi:hypothetical protein
MSSVLLEFRRHVVAAGALIVTDGIDFSRDWEYDRWQRADTDRTLLPST